MPDSFELAIAAAVLLFGMALGTFAWELSTRECERRAQGACVAASMTKAECAAYVDQICQ